MRRARTGKCQRDADPAQGLTVPRRKVKDSLIPPEAEAAALAAMREALAHPRVLTADEERDFLERRAHGAIERHEYTATIRRGKLVYRTAGKAGADLDVPPYYWEMLKRQRDFETECAKVERGIGTKRRNMRALPRKAGEARRARILAAVAKLSHLPERNRAAVAAKRLGVSVRTVRRVFKEKRPVPKGADSGP